VGEIAIVPSAGASQIFWKLEQAKARHGNLCITQLAPLHLGINAVKCLSSVLLERPLYDNGSLELCQFSQAHQQLPPAGCSWSSWRTEKRPSVSACISWALQLESDLPKCGSTCSIPITLFLSCNGRPTLSNPRALVWIRPVLLSHSPAQSRPVY
jgi:hypothetical protein